MSAPAGPRLLLVDDDDGFRTALARALERRGLSVRAVADGATALAAQRQERIDWVVLDLRLHGECGIDLVERLLAQCPAVEIVILTAYGSIATAVDAIKRGAVDYLSKPVDPDQLVAAFEAGEPPAPEVAAEPPTLRRLEWEYIQQVLVECEGNVSAAARRLGLHRRSLQRKLSKRPVGR